ncbi:MAG: hypothetical protein KDA79_00170 [Planctomycetaceae bacterium]|nr:hypothetical protein [Planctomycetaceae bacterium]
MNRLSSRNRKVVYLVGMIVLLVPIIVLGMPAASGEGSGGYLARLRQEHDLGETSLGEVDPSSATMNLVLLGLRGVATNILWMQLQEQKETKQWFQMKATTDSITQLQPHFLKVWQYHGWNLAFNVSAEWDQVEDRYYWVKEGTKFTMQGSRRNERFPELYWDVGNMLGKKIGRSDEWQFFRRFYKSDPNTKLFEGGPDPEISRFGASEFEDNYLASKYWFHVANDKEESQAQHIMMRMVFRQYPARAQMDYADALQREGLFGERTGQAWAEAYRDWTEQYRTGDPGFGQEIFYTPAGGVRLEASEADMRELAKKDSVSLRDKRTWTSRYQDIVSYRYWRTRSDAESRGKTEAAHREIFEGQKLFREGRLLESKEMLEAGMEKFASLLEDYPSLTSDDGFIEEGLMAVLYWRHIHTLLEIPFPENFALRKLWEKEAARIPSLEIDFRRDNGIG